MYIYLHTVYVVSSLEPKVLVELLVSEGDYSVSCVTTGHLL